MSLVEHAGLAEAISRRDVVGGAAASVVAGATQAHASAPSPALTLRFASADRSSGRIPLRFDAAAHLRVQAVVCGQPVSAILDTGAARSVLDRSFADRLGLPRRPGFDVAGIVDNAHGEMAEDVSVRLGGLTLDRLEPGLIDLARVVPSSGGPIAAIIGRELFQRTVADFDFANRTVAFVDAAMPLELPSASTVALGETPRGTPHVPVAIDGRAPVEAGLDIGYNAALLVSPAYAAQAGLLDGRRVSTVASVGVEGASVSQVASIDSLRLGGVVLSDVPIEVPVGWNRSVPAIIGLDIVKKFRMLTDYSRRRVGLFADPGEIAKPLPKDRSGIGAAPVSGGLAVVHVAAGSPAERIGLRVGDRIEAIDGAPVDLAYLRSHPRMGAGPAGSVFVLGLAGGRTLRLTLADYY